MVSKKKKMEEMKEKNDHGEKSRLFSRSVQEFSFIPLYRSPRVCVRQQYRDICMCVKERERALFEVSAII